MIVLRGVREGGSRTSHLPKKIFKNDRIIGIGSLSIKTLTELGCKRGITCEEAGELVFSQCTAPRKRK